MANSLNKKTGTNGQPFRPRARILRTLGEELISNELVAVVELVKNSFDADATRILVRFNEPIEGDCSYGSIEVIDNGNGMTLETVRTVWLEPATPQKRNSPLSRKLKRRVLGEKGIGRFASARLAKELEVATRSEGAAKEVFGLFDWSQFDNESLYLDEVIILTEERAPEEICAGGIIDGLWNDITERENADRTHGTMLRMKGLKQQWTRQSVETLHRGLNRLVSPFADLNEFSVYLELPERLNDLAGEIQPPELFKYPHYTVRGDVAADGTFTINTSVHVSGEKSIWEGQFIKLPAKPETVRAIEKPGKPPQDAIHPKCGPLTFQFFVWDRDDLGNIVQVTKSSIRDIRKDLDTVAGINIYRDGFRVLPYGEPNNDWLRLDIRRVQKPTYNLSNNQITGYILISSDRNPGLKDQSNREGLDETEAMQDLRQIVFRALERLEAKRSASRRPKTKSEKSGLGTPLFSALDLDPLREHIKTEHPGDKKSQRLISEVEKELAQRVEQIKTVLGRYHSLATLGQLVDVLLHDGRHPIQSIRTQALLGQEDVQSSTIDADLSDNLFKRFSKIGDQGNVLHTVFRRIEPFAGRKRGRPSKLYLETIIEETFAIFETELSKHKIEVSLPSSQTLVSVDDAEMKEVIMNLVNNSIYWLQQVEPESRHIKVRVERLDSNHLEITFGDSGPGVTKELRNEIFEPYFSTKPEGVGLGLAIAGEIVKDYYDGDLELLESGFSPGAVFRITLRKRV